FLSGREGKKTQVWRLSREGGVPARTTNLAGGVSSFVWSPDGSRLALVASDPDPDDPDADGGDADPDKKPSMKTRKPIVIRRLQFKRDGEGYLREVRRHLHVFDVDKKRSFQLTGGAYDDSQPAWSPDGRWIAFTSNRTADPDANQNTDIFVIAARPGEQPRGITTSEGRDASPAFSPDGRSIAYLAGGDPKDMWYGPNH